MLYLFELEPDETKPPGAGAEILQGENGMGRPATPVDVVGRLTSVAPFPVDGRFHALGYLSRKADPEAPTRTEDAQVLALTRA